MRPTRFTRRRAVALGATAGAAAVVPRLALPALGSAAGDPGLIRLRATPGAVLRAPRPFVLVGAEADAGAGLSVRARATGGRWGPWLSLPAQAHGPDRRARGARTEPAWTGRADELQLAARRPPRGPVTLLLVPDTGSPPGVPVARAAQAGGPAIIPRAAWGGATIVPRAAPTYGTVQLAFVHHTVNANTYAEDEAAAIVLAIARYHRNANRWNDIGYNFLVDRFGRIYEGRAGGTQLAVVGAQAGGWNSVSTGVSIIGTFDSLAAPAPALEAVADLLAWKLPLHGAPVSGSLTLVSSGGSANRWRAGAAVTFQRISGHRDGCSTDCPGNALYAQLPDLRALTQARAGSAVPKPVPTVSLATPPPAARFGEQLLIGGTVLEASGTPAAGRAVAIQKRGARRWVTVARVRTDDQGTFGAELPWRRGGTVRAIVPGAGAAAASPPVAVRCDGVLQAERARPRVRAGHRARVAGRTVPRARLTVTVEQRDARGAYRTVGSLRATAAGDGRFRVGTVLGRPGLYRLTVRYPGGDGIGPASSGPLFVRAVRGGT